MSNKNDTKTFFRRESENIGLVDLLIKMNETGYSRTLIEAECKKLYPGCGVTRHNLGAVLAHYGIERVDKEPELCNENRRKFSCSRSKKIKEAQST